MHEKKKGRGRENHQTKHILHTTFASKMPVFPFPPLPLPLPLPSTNFFFFFFCGEFEEVKNNWIGTDWKEGRLLQPANMTDVVHHIFSRRTKKERTPELLR